MALPPIPVKSTTRVGMPLTRVAKQLAFTARATKVPSKQQLRNGFIVRGVKMFGDRYMGQVIDTPGYIVFAGALQADSLTTFNIGGPAGIRDDYDGKGTDTTYEAKALGKYLVFLSPTAKDPTNGTSAAAWLPQMRQSGPFLGPSIMTVAYSQDPPEDNLYYLDDMDYFSYRQNVVFSGAIGSLFSTGLSVTVDPEAGVSIGTAPRNYFVNTQFSVSELDLLDDWKFYLRRLAPQSASLPPYDQRVYPGDTMPGYAFIEGGPPGDMERGTIDRYCLAAQTFRQYQEVWNIPPENKTGWDTKGERGLMVALGSFTRHDYVNRPGVSWFAKLDELRVVVPTDIQQEYLHPTPEVLPGDGTGPSLPNYGTFYTPNPVKAGEGFVVFSSYVTLLDLSEGSGSSNRVGDATSILTTLADGTTISLKADWNCEDGFGPIETGTAGLFSRPWIAGSASIDRGEDIGIIGYCVVWEQNYTLGSFAEQPVGLGGNWAIYACDGEAVTRTAIEGGCPVFGALMQTYNAMPSSANADNQTAISGAYWMGATKLVTSGSPDPLDTNDVRDIVSVVFDVATGTVTLGGVITQTSSIATKCTITVVQLERRDEKDVLVAPAVLLASVTENLVGAAGQGKTYLSVDGGEKWREYVTDAAGQGGAFYHGNKLWQYDQNKPFSAF